MVFHKSVNFRAYIHVTFERKANLEKNIWKQSKLRENLILQRVDSLTPKK